MELTMNMRFTLTMWDVKEGYEPVIRNGDFSFTLTMWDVKQLEFEEYRQSNTVLP